MRRDLGSQIRSVTIRVGPIVATQTPDSFIVRLAVEPPEGPWPLWFEMDVCEAMDALIEPFPDWALEPDGWEPSQEVCPFVRMKVDIQRKVAAKLRERARGAGPGPGEEARGGDGPDGPA